MVPVPMNIPLQQQSNVRLLGLGIWWVNVVEGQKDWEPKMLGSYSKRKEDISRDWETLNRLQSSSDCLGVSVK